jgi:hypothetical protein
VGSLLLYYAVIASYLFSAALFGADMAAVLAHNGRDAWVTPPFHFWLILQFLWAATAVGLFFFLRWGRTLFLFLNLYTVVGFVAGGLVIQTGLQAAVLYLVNLADGAVLFMAYLSAVASRFGRRRPNSTPRPEAPQSGSKVD